MSPMSKNKHTIEFLKNEEVGTTREVDEGELILIVGRTDNPLLAVFQEGHSEWREKIIFDSKYRLKNPIEIDGTTFPGVLTSPGGNMSQNNINDLYIGKKEVIGYCKKRGWDIHAKWIRKLRKPYIFPRIKTEHYLNFS